MAGSRTRGKLPGDRLARTLARHVVPEGALVRGAPAVGTVAVAVAVTVVGVVAVAPATAVVVLLPPEAAAEPRHDRQGLHPDADQRRADHGLVGQQRGTSRAVEG